MTLKVTLAITGASGMPYALKLLSELLTRACLVNVVISKAGMLTLKQELDLTLSANVEQSRLKLIETLNLTNSGNLKLYAIADWFAPMASGSSVDDAMVVCPCSMATLGKIASGIGDDLISRSADVILKERKNLIIVPRETPFSTIHLENMLRLSRLGVAIVAPIPAFYNHPKTLDDVINFIVSRILDQLGINNSLTKRW
ncbi:MAG TPA: flavin prenyltransferase UbiX [Burkholderiales bacterium]|jgi:4-hydroxy-3-polyprenylbenzoate decarboxylase|nr:flavin prenyltransferase UbiX [Burkholderiales bacterium]